jgi:catechol 2,3-dioxygenase
MTSTFTDITATPLRIGRVRLRVRDLAAVAAFYERIIGLEITGTGEGSLSLGSAGAPLLDLVEERGAPPRMARDAGLFHIAFLLPRRSDLARWLAHSLAQRVAIEGASNHIVSEAIYLSDPEGNGIEIYADRPVSDWRDPATGAIHMTTAPLDARDLLAAGEGRDWAGFPTGGTIGHVHLQVGDAAQAEAFYSGIIGFDIASRYPGATFFGSGGYHHQLAGNTWNSRGAGPRTAGECGLDRLEIIVADPARHADILRRAARAGALDADMPGTLRDPWGTAIAITA